MYTSGVEQSAFIVHPYLKILQDLEALTISNQDVTNERNKNQRVCPDSDQSGSSLCTSSSILFTIGKVCHFNMVKNSKAEAGHTRSLGMCSRVHGGVYIVTCLCLYCGDPSAVHEHDIHVFHTVNNLGPDFRVQECGACLCWKLLFALCECGGRGGSSELH